MSTVLLNSARRLAEKRGTDDSPWYKELRANSLDELELVGLPRYRKDEAWRYTNVSSLNDWDVEKLSPLSSFSVDTDFQVFALREKWDAPWVKNALQKNKNAFDHLNAALMREGVVIDVPAGKSATVAIHFHDVGGVISPRVVVRLSEGSRLKLVETLDSTEGMAGFGNIVEHLELGKDSKLEHYRVQNGSVRSFYLQNIEVEQDAGSEYRSTVISLGGRLGREELSVRLNGVRSRCELNGLFLGKGEQQLDHRTLIEHAVSDCESSETYRGVLSDKAVGVFDGRIKVQADAQRTLSNQSNKNLLLSSDATINTKPQLEIYADDVKCAHGATSGQLNEDAIFYLRSRGLSESQARVLLTTGFAMEIVEKLPEELRKSTADLVQGWLA